jgi:regulation of enolase protein 1 (concanavalin A-like superfamily)/predicted Ser/Thr protein kinase
MIPNDPDRESPPALLNGQCGSHDPEETSSYPPAVSWPSATTGPASPSIRHERFNCLESPRATGECGWLAHYRVLRLLGQGGMGLVFLAEDSLLSRLVALKVIRPEIVGTPDIAQRFTREARATAAIKHDHIVTIYQVGQENGVPFLSMEYLKGMSLAQWLDRGHIPSVDLVLRIGREIALGLSAAHQRGLIHRDIKPGNIWLEAPSGRVKILDFGMARSVREDVEITRSGTVMGSPAYMAPEQARGEAVGSGSDLFGLGCVMYRLCTGHLPFEGKTVMAVLTALSTITPSPPRDWREELPPALSELVLRLLAKDPAHRPESAEAVVKEIRSIEREVIAARKKAEVLAPVPRLGIAGSIKQALRAFRAATSPTQQAATLQTRRRTLKIAAAALAMFAATAVMLFSSVALRRSTDAHLVAARTSAPARDLEAHARAVLPKTDGARVAQVDSSPHDLGLRAERNSVSMPSLRDSSSLPQSSAATRPGPDAASQGSQVKDQPAAHIARSTRKIGEDLPSVVTVVQERKADGPARSARADEAWGDAVDSDGDCKFEREPHENKLRIIVPGKTHILSAEIGRVNAPRVLRDVKGDFDLSVRVEGTNHPGGKATTTVYPPYHGAGLVIWQNPENYVRLEIAADVQRGKVRPYVNFEYRNDGVLAFSQGLKNEDGSNHLRLKRRGDEIHASFGPDGFRWTSFPPLTAQLSDRLNVGVTAINSSTKPLTAEFEGFDLLDRGPG